MVWAAVAAALIGCCCFYVCASRCCCAAVPVAAAAPKAVEEEKWVLVELLDVALEALEPAASAEGLCCARRCCSRSATGDDGAAAEVTTAMLALPLPSVSSDVSEMVLLHKLQPLPAGHTSVMAMGAPQPVPQIQLHLALLVVEARPEGKDAITMKEVVSEAPEANNTTTGEPRCTTVAVETMTDPLAAPVPIIQYVDRVEVKEVRVEVPVPFEVIRVQEARVEVPVEVIRLQEVVTEVPVEVVKEVPTHIDAPAPAPFFTHTAKKTTLEIVEVDIGAERRSPVDLMAMRPPVRKAPRMQQHPPQRHRTGCPKASMTSTGTLQDMRPTEHPLPATEHSQEPNHQPALQGQRAGNALGSCYSTTTSTAACRQWTPLTATRVRETETLSGLSSWSRATDSGATTLTRPSQTGATVTQLSSSRGGLTAALMKAAAGASRAKRTSGATAKPTWRSAPVQSTRSASHLLKGSEMGSNSCLSPCSRCYASQMATRSSSLASVLMNADESYNEPKGEVVADGDA